MSNFQYVTFVAFGGTPVRLADQTGAPYPTTGNGALVFANGALLTNPTLNGATFSGPYQFPAGSAAAPTITFTGNTNTGIYQSAANHVDFAVAGLAAGGWSSSGLSIVNGLSVGGNVTSGTWHGTTVGPTYGGTGVANASTITIGGNFTMSGAFTFAGTLINTTAVTFPTSGTLATTANISAALPSGTSSQIYVGTGVAGVAAVASTLPTAAFPALTGDITTAGGALATTLATVATGATTGSSTAIPVVTFSNKGLVTGITTAAVVAPAGTLTGTTLAATVVASSLTSVGTIATGVWNGTKIGLALGGTNADLSATGGASQVLKQVSGGAAITVAQLAASDLSNGTTGSGAVALAGSPSFTSDVTLASAHSLIWSGVSKLFSQTDGNIVLLNNNGSSFNLLQFGGLTAGFAALKRVNTTIVSRLADDSADGPFQSSTLTTGAPAGASSGVWKLGSLVTGGVVLDTTRSIFVDIGGTVYKVLVST